MFPRLEDNDLLRGIPGSPTDHHGAPFSLTEEFVAGLPHAHADAGRLHVPLGGQRRRARASFELPALSGRRGVDVLARFNPVDLFYSFGIAYPGAVRLHNYPRTLQNLVQDNGERFDLGTVDILRDRERGVPRYNQFRRLLHKPAVESFDEI